MVIKDKVISDTDERYDDYITRDDKVLFKKWSLVVQNIIVRSIYNMSIY